MSKIVNLSGIPSPENERPWTSFNGILLANKAWHCRLEDLWPPRHGEQPPSPDQKAAIDVYLANFCRPIKSIAREVQCVACNQLLSLPYGAWDKTALQVDETSPTLEARCGGCGYPVRARHFINLLPPAGHIPVVQLDFFPMCYHPQATQSLGG